MLGQHLDGIALRDGFVEIVPELGQEVLEELLRVAARLLHNAGDPDNMSFRDQRDVLAQSSQ